MKIAKRLLISMLKSAVIILLIMLFCALALDWIPLMEPNELTDDPESIEPILRALLWLILPIPFYTLAEQFDTVKRKELLTSYTGLPKTGQIVAETLTSFSFWSDALLLLIPFSAIAPSFLSTSTDTGFLPHFGLNLLCYALPLAAVCLYIESRVRRSWYREWEFTSRTSKDAILANFVNERPPYGRLALNIAFIAAGVWLLPTIFWALATFVIAGASVLADSILRILLAVLAIIAALILWRALKTVRERRKFFKNLGKVCKERGYELKTRKNTLRGLFICTGRDDFTLETPDQRYVGSILPVPSKNCTLYFRMDYDGGGYCFQRIILRFNVFFPRHKLIYSGEQSAEQADRILLLTKEPANILGGDRDRSWRLYNGVKTDSYTVYDAVAFCNFIDRKHL